MEQLASYFLLYLNTCKVIQKKIESVIAKYTKKLEH